jgi:hypothetical protein
MESYEWDRADEAHTAVEAHEEGRVTGRGVGLAPVYIAVHGPPCLHRTARPATASRCIPAVPKLRRDQERSQQRSELEAVLVAVSVSAAASLLPSPPSSISKIPPRSPRIWPALSGRLVDPRCMFS